MIKKDFKNIKKEMSSKKNGKTMKDRGESSFIKLPKFAARLYDKMMQLAPMKLQRIQIAKELLDHIEEGRLLDVGTGHGRLLSVIHEMNSNIELYGIDISEKMVNLAKDNLKDFKINLQQGNIKNTTYYDNFFDLITSTGSFYLWNHPIESLNEIYRVLKPNRCALLFDSHKEYDKKELKKSIASNLQNEGFFTKKIVPFFLKRQLKMTYDIKELEGIINNTKFKDDFSINKITFANLPIWLKIELVKKISPTS